MNEKQVFTTFFRDDSIEMLGLETPGDVPHSEELSFREKEEALPVIPPSTTVEELDRKTYWRMLRVFFRTGKGGGIDNAQVYPALLAPYHRTGLLQTGYPLWMKDGASEESTGTGYLSVSEMLRQLVAQLAPGEADMKILKDNLPRLEKIIRDKLSFADVVYDAKPVFEEALQELINQLSIKGDEGKIFQEDVNKLKGKLPGSGVLIPYFKNTPFHLLSVFLSNYRREERKALETQVEGLIARLNELMAAEKEKSPEARSSEHLHDTLDFADTFLNFDELSSVLPSATEDAMPEERLQRIEKIWTTLREVSEGLLEVDASMVISAEIADSYDLEWSKHFQKTLLQYADPGEVCKKTKDLFDRRMKEAARIFGAIRLANLELENRYQPELHADFFAHFNWRAFTETELAACPPVVLLADATSLLHTELNELSEILASGRPVKLLALTREISLNGEEENAPLSEPLLFRQELGALAIAHRNTFVLQTTPADPSYILEGFRNGCHAHTPAVFHLFAPVSQEHTRDNLFLKTSAAVEGREFPAFTYNTEKGPKWGRRFDLNNNPQPKDEWPGHLLLFKEAGGEKSEMALPFTFADFAAQDAHFTGEYQLVPPAYWGEELVPLHEYLSLSADEQFSVIPFIWMVDKKDRLQKAAISWRLVLACKERLDFWHYLQENTGIHSYHVEKATEKLRKETEAAYAKKIEAIEKKHAEEVARVREETARIAMERLAATLLDMDGGMDIAAAVTSPAPVAKAPEKAKTESKPEPVKEAAPPEPEPEKEEEADLMLGEAWIDTPLCTTCNECIDLNKQIFKYNADKQAYVANPKGGPFSDIVKAAEACPVSIIHPGAPQNPNEPGLEEWVKRAEKYN